MMKKIFIYIGLVVALSACGSKQQYAVTSMQGERIPVITTDKPNKEMVELVEKYKHKLDQEMNQEIGYSNQEMTFSRPESLLTNFTSDAMQQLSIEHTGTPLDLAVMNVHGHRANMPKGKITVGNIFEIYSFDNELVVLQLKGSDLDDIFESYAKMGGAGLSSTARLIIKNKKLIDAKVGGKSIDPKKIYTIVTLDYLAEGNDGMEAFEDAVSVKRTGIILREYMLDYIKKLTADGKTVSSKLDGRISVQ